MANRFSVREMVLLTVPVLFLAGLGLWFSRNPHPVAVKGKWRLTFHLDQPTTLEAFEGYEGAFVVEAIDPSGKSSIFRQGAPYLELKTPLGVESTRFRNLDLLSGVNPWGSNLNNSRFTFKLRGVPSGALSFGFDAVVTPPAPPGSPPAPAALPVRLSGKWKVDRTQIQPSHLAALQRKPLVTIQSVIFTGATSANVTGTIKLSLVGGAMDDSTPLESALTSNGNGMGWSTSDGNVPSGRIRVIEWSASRSTTSKLSSISGRVSAGNHWPLGFEIEPFDAKHLKIGQALKFKQVPVALPAPQRQ